MPQPPAPDTLLKVRKLAQLSDELRRGEHFELTRLTVLKSLCQDPETANRLVTYLARKTLERVERAKDVPGTSPRDRPRPTNG